MASSFRDNPYRRPNFATDGAIPSYLSKPRNPPIPPIFSPQPAPWPDPPTVPGPFPAPIPVPQIRPPHDVNPPESNPDNDPNYSPFLVTENQAMGTVDTPQGGLLGRLLAVFSEQANNASNSFGSGRENLSRMAEADAASPQELDDEQKAIRILGRRVVRY